MSTLHRAGVVLAMQLASAAAVPVIWAATPVAGPSYEQKLAWILRLEDQRMLRDPVQQPVAVPEPEGKKKKKKSKAPDEAPPMTPDLVAMLKDADARIRRRRRAPRTPASRGPEYGPVRLVRCVLKRHRFRGSQFSFS